MRWLILWVAAGALAVAAESAASGFEDVTRWLPDFVTGAALLGGGIFAAQRRPEQAAGPLLALSGAAWFAGGVWGGALFLHRGPLVHAMLAFPSWRPARRIDSVAIAIGYATAFLVPVGESAQATMALGAALAFVAATGLRRPRMPPRESRRPATAPAALGQPTAARESGRPAIAPAARGATPAAGESRRLAAPGRRAAVAVGVVLVAGAGARLAFGADEAALLAYEAVLCAVAVALAAAAAARPWERVTDLVVELAAAPSGTLRDALAQALGDPTLEVGYAAPDGFVGADGRPLGEPGPGRALTLVERDGEPVAALVHDAGVLDDPRLVASISQAAQLAASNARLQAEVRDQIADLEASRARLLAVAGEERTRLELRLRDGAERRLARIAATLSDARQLPGGEIVERPAAVLEQARADLRTLAHGLAPGRLADALAALASASAVAVELTVVADGIDPEASAVAYFVCAEAFANASKHAGARRVAIDVRAVDGRLAVEVADDGAGGADPRKGTGLRGLAERVEACGGSLLVDSPPGQGTRVAASLPLRQQLAD